MHQVYDWNTRVLSLTTKNKISYHLHIRKDIVIVNGVSASGKTMLCHLIEDAKKDKNPVMLNDVSNIIVLNSDNLPLLTGYDRKLIIIDEAHLILTKEDIDFVNCSTNLRFLIFDRVPIGLNTTPNAKADMVCENGVFQLNYRYNVKGW